MAEGGIGNQSPATLFQARLDTSDGVSSTLTLGQYIGNKVVVSGLTVSIPPSGLTRDIADNLIDANGDDAGAPPAASTLYYVYVSNARATFSPSSIRLSATAPSLVNGVRYLGGTGNALNWRFVGWVMTNATPEFESSDTNALIVNYYNRLTKSIFANPGYVDDNAQTSYVVNGNWAPANGGVDSQVKFISNGEDACIIKARAVVASAANITTLAGAGIDGNEPENAGEQGLATGGATTVTADESQTLPEGDHTADLYGASNGGASAFIADEIRLGAAADPRCSMVTVDLYV